MNGWQAANVALQVLGGLCVVVWLVWLLRSRQWRAPLAGVQVRAARVPPDQALLELAAPVAVYLAVLGLLLPLIAPDGDDLHVRTPGSHAWHLAGLVETLGKLAALVAAILVLRARPAFAAKPRPLHCRGLVLLVLGGALGATTVCLLELYATNAAWEALGNPPAQHPVFKAFYESAWGIWGRAFLLVSPIVVAPLCEEVIFRGVLLQLLWRITGHPWLAIVASGVAFGLIHTSVPPSVPPLITFGIILGYLRLRHGSLTACIVIHALFNARPMLLILVAPDVLEG